MAAEPSTCCGVEASLEEAGVDGLQRALSVLGTFVVEIIACRGSDVGFAPIRRCDPPQQRGPVVLSQIIVADVAEAR